MMRYGEFGVFHNPLGVGIIVFMIIMAILTILTVVAVVIIVKKINKSSRQYTEDASLEELKVRFAKGEISEEEYFRMKRVLKQ